jgi:hypothetical protein
VRHFSGVDTEGSIKFAIGISASHEEHASTAALYPQHQSHKFMWGTTAEGESFDVVVTTLHHSHALHGGTRDSFSVPLHGFVFNGTLFLDPAGVHCEPSSSSLPEGDKGVGLRGAANGTWGARSLVPASADAAALLYDYGDMLEAWGAEAEAEATTTPPQRASCNIGGRVVHNVSPAAAARLSTHLWQEARPSFDGLPRRHRVPPPLPARMRRVAPSDGASSIVEPDREQQRRELKTSVAQSAGSRPMLIVRAVWSDQNESNALPLATYLRIAWDFVQWANNASYGNMVRRGGGASEDVVRTCASGLLSHSNPLPCLCRFSKLQSRRTVCMSCQVIRTRRLLLTATRSEAGYSLT